MNQIIVRIIFVCLSILIIFVSYTGNVFAEEPRLATYHETATILVDQKLSNNVTASVSLQTTSLHEFQIPQKLDEKIRNSTDIIAVVVTNEDQCVLGVQDKVCIMINVKRVEGEGGIKEAQLKAKAAGDLIINDINDFFGMDAKFHSVFIHYDDKANQILGTQGQVSGRGTVSAVYVIPFQNTDFLFTKISSSLIPRQIRDFGGFYDTAQKLSKDDSSRVTFTILPHESISIMQLKVSEKYSNVAKNLTHIDPLEFLKADQIKKSDYFSGGFFPLNSIVHVVILPLDESITVHATNTIESIVKNNQTIPASLEASGWFFEYPNRKIEGMYLFGKESIADSRDLTISLGEVKQEYFSSSGLTEILILIGIGVTATGAAAYYLKGMKVKKS